MTEQNWRDRLPESLSGASRVWVYQNNRPFTPDEEKAITVHLKQFTADWMSHNRPVNGWATVLFRQFILVMADDTMDRLCGSAVDSAIRLIKELEQQYDLQLMDRLQMGFVKKEEILIIPMNEVEKALAAKEISHDTLFFNNAVATKEELLNHWILPLDHSYLWKRVSDEAGISR